MRFETVFPKKVIDVETESGKAGVSVKCVIFLCNSNFIIDFVTLKYVMKQISITSELDTYLLLLILNILEICSEIKEELLC